MKEYYDPPPVLDPVRLLEVIRIQTDIAKQGLDLGGVMALVAHHAQHLTRAIGAVVELVDGDEMVYRATSGIAESLLGLRLKRQGSLSGRCIEEGRPLCCDDSETDERVDRAACRRVGLRSMIVEPLKHNGVPVGVLKVLASTPNAFNEVDMKTLELLAEPIAAAMFFAAKYESSELFHRASHDGLTGLSNRAYFYDRFRQRLEQARSNQESFAILSFDMDGLKQINDCFGHRAGDAAIKEFASRLLASSAQGDTVARMGGDEFSIIGSRSGNQESASLLASHFARNIGTPFQFGAYSLSLDASLGFAVFPEDGADIEELLETADQRMYKEKRRRKGDRGKREPEAIFA
jgi:diguanylate cyclase (GGDEF)-like protein